MAKVDGDPSSVGRFFRVAVNWNSRTFAHITAAAAADDDECSCRCLHEDVQLPELLHINFPLNRLKTASVLQSVFTLKVLQSITFKPFPYPTTCMRTTKENNAITIV